MNLYDDAHWQDAPEYGNGAQKKTLRDKDGKKTILIRVPEHYRMPEHSHITAEQHFILRGEYTSNGKTYKEGDYQFFGPHEKHGPFESKKGVMILVIWDPDR